MTDKEEYSILENHPIWILFNKKKGEPIIGDDGYPGGIIYFWGEKCDSIYYGYGMEYYHGRITKIINNEDIYEIHFLDAISKSIKIYYNKNEVSNGIYPWRLGYNPNESNDNVNDYFIILSTIDQIHFPIKIPPKIREK